LSIRRAIRGDEPKSSPATIIPSPALSPIDGGRGGKEQQKRCIDIPREIEVDEHEVAFGWVFKRNEDKARAPFIAGA
jgi:hypothetical protein